MSQFNNRSHNSNNIPTAMFADCLANSKEIFELISSIFPLDSCRHYGVLPLSLDGNNLSLGILEPSNEESLKFVNSIAKVFKYNLHFKLIDEQTLQIILASYPQNSSQSRGQNRNRDREKTVIDATVIDDQFAPSKPPRSRMSDSAPTVVSETDNKSSYQKPPAPGLSDLPPDLDFLKDLDLSPKHNSKPAEVDATLHEIPPEFLSQRAANDLDNKATLIAEDPSQLLAQSTADDEAELALEEAQISDLIAEATKEKIEQVESDDFLPKLGLQLSWQKLLEQAFKYSSEEIYLTRYSDFGNVVANKDELPQSYAEQIPLPIFCSVIDEIKRMARIPLDMSNHPKKVVLERFYNQERILLRLEFAFKNERETVLVQILRGDNLQIYEQLQMDKLSEQALHLAQQLEKTVRRIQACFDSAELTNLRELQTVQSRISHQLRLLDR